MFLKINSVKVSLREYLYEGGLLLKPLVFLIAVFLKLFRIPIPGSTDVPPVTRLSDFRSTDGDLPDDLATSLSAVDAELRKAGFQSADVVFINDTAHNTQYASRVYVSAGGETIAWLRDRRWPQLPRSSKFPRVAFYSQAQNGKVVMTTSANRDLLDPPDWDVRYKTRMPASELLADHRLHLSDCLGAQRPRSLASPESALAVLDRFHEQFVDFQRDRGVFVDTQPAEAIPVAQPVAEDGDVETDHFDLVGTTVETSSPDSIDPIVQEVRKLETKQTGWIVKLAVLGISVALFVGLGAAQWDLKLALMLVPILFVHEMGHYIAMLIFGYKNVQMFFIPLLGAAVSGRHYQVAGWKKAMVSLAGPLPSIFLGLILGCVGVYLQSETLLYACLLTLVLNVFNLLPFLPLDGGWVAHVTLFARSRTMDLLFRIGTIVTLVGGSILLKDRILLFFAIAMAAGLPFAWKTIQATRIARKQEFPAPVDDQIPEEAIRQIVAAVQEANIPVQGAKPMAQTVVNVYESVATKPPSWPATAGIWALHAGAVMLALVGGILISAAQFLRNELFDQAEYQTQNVVVDPTDGQFSLGDGELPAGELLMWDYGDADSASQAFDSLRDQSDHTVARLGTLVFTSRPTVEQPEALDSDLSEKEYAIEVEKQCRKDVRLSEAPTAPLQRRFASHELPSLIVSFASGDQADSVVESISRLPQPMSDHFPICPWTPRQEITAEQQQLRHTLALLQGRVDDLPWKTEEDAVSTDGELSEKNLQQILAESRRRYEQQMAKRRQWMEAEMQQSSGNRQQLIQAYLQYESDLEKWEEEIENRLGGEEPLQKQPEVESYLEPILPALGFLDSSDPMHRFSTRAHAFAISEEDWDQPLPITGHLVQINVHDAQDPAAAFGGIMAWLKKTEATGITWQYIQAVLPEDEPNADDQ